MDKPKTGPKDFFLWAGAMIALYVSAFSLLALFFDYIDVAFPDSLNLYFDPYSSGIRVAIASLVVMFPLFLVLMHFIRSDIAREPPKKDLWVRRWALVLTIFISGLTAVIDLITLINTFLGGELTMQFVLKILVVFLLMSAALMHFLADYWGYWNINPRYARSVAIAVGVMVVATILSGFLIIGTPSQIRMYRFDDQKVSDLGSIQSEIVNYWQTEQKLPTTLADLDDSISGFTIPTDPQTGLSYQYQVLPSLHVAGSATSSAIVALPTFELCANFNAVTQSDSPTIAYAPSLPASVGTMGQDIDNDGWYHAAGNKCFVRSIDPKRYPPFATPSTKSS